MTEALLEHPAELAEGSTYGGFADIARRLNALHPERPKPFSRQLVQRWFVCRASNGMPDRRPVEVEGKVRPLFDLQAVERWHKARGLTRRPSVKPIETIPLFHVDARGSIVSGN